MPIAFRAAATVTGNGVGSVALSVPTGTVNDDILIAVVLVSTADAVTAPAGWTLKNSQAYNGAAGSINTYWRRAAGEPASYTWTSAGTPDWNAVMLAYSGVTTTGDPIDAIGALAVAANGTDAVDAPSITVTNAQSMLVCAFAVRATNSFTPPPGMTERADVSAALVDGSLALADLLVAAGATGTRTATRNSTTNLAEIGVSLALLPPSITGLVMML